MEELESGTYFDIPSKIKDLPPAQTEQDNDSEFWRKRADFYSDTCMKLIGEMGKGVKIASVKISENGIEFIKEQPTQPERRRGKWILVRDEEAGNALYMCSACGKGDIHAPEVKVSYCWNCGAQMER